MDENSNDSLQLIEGVLNNVRPPLLDFILVNENNDYKEYNVITKKIVQ